jgi:hypothetical protein
VKNIYQKVLAGYVVVLIGYWVLLHLSHKQTSNYNYVYSLMFSLVPLIGGFVGMLRSKIWGRLKSHLGKAVFFVSLGLFLWGAGSMVWSYYNIVLKDALPYPSLADLGFAPSIVFWAIGVVFLSKASGASFALRKSTLAKIFTAVTPVVILGVSYYLLVHVARQGTVVPEGETALKVILDIAYPFGDFLALTLSLIIFGLSFKYFGGYYRQAIVFILFGLGIMFFGDFIFSYTTTVGTFFNGDWGDLVLTAGLAGMTFGILGFCIKPVLAKKTTETAEGA